MRLIILGLKNKETGEYMVYDVENRRKPKHQPIKIGETLTVSCLAPFPFEHYSSISFDYQEKLLTEWSPCYLEIEGELSEQEFKGMKSSGIAYYRFPKRKITLISEFEDIFQYSLEVYKKMKSRIGLNSFTTWIIHNETKSEDEKTAMSTLIKYAMNSNKNKKYGTDFSLDKYVLPYIHLLLDYKSKGYNVTFGRHGYVDLSQDELNSIELTPSELLLMIQEITLRAKVSFFEHPIFTQDFYDNTLSTSESFVAVFNSIYNEHDVNMISARIDVETMLKDVLDKKLPQFDESTNWDMEGVTFKEACTRTDYPVQEIEHSPYDYYCCQDCDGYELSVDESDFWVEYKDNRVDLILEVLNQHWAKCLPDRGRSIFDFVPDSLWRKVEEALRHED